MTRDGLFEAAVADRRALLTAGDALAERAEVVTHGPGPYDSGGDTWWEAHELLAAALAAWKAATG
jgi:hypothetical protein